MNILLFIQAVVGILLIIVIFMQKSGADGLSGLQGSPTNTGIVSTANVASFLTRLTTILAVIFMVNSLILANFSSSAGSIKKVNVTNKEKKNEDDNIKIAE
jgi:preprotein translocase subunit SecG